VEWHQVGIDVEVLGRWSSRANDLKHRAECKVTPAWTCKGLRDFNRVSGFGGFDP
jgi:hypothetical protein